ncbi:MAG: diguanylate cyclase [Gammaproteobacteria bacterium]|nr:diguanylate cyclase [Gammaproteobacteria bacterium]
MLKSQNISIRSITIILLAMIAILSVLVSLISSENFIDSAEHAQTASVRSIFEVAAKEVIGDAHKSALKLAHSVAINDAIRNSFSNKKVLESNKLASMLDEPFIKGFVGSADIDLVKIRVYDLVLNFVAESNSGIPVLENNLSDVIYSQAYSRTGADRVMALGGLWVANDVLYYSVLVPVGGIRIVGYLEVIINPVRNLVNIASRIHMPVALSSVASSGRFYYRPKVLIEHELEVDYVLVNHFNDPVVRLTAYSDITNLRHEITRTIFASISIFICLVILVLFFSLWLFRKFLFKPLTTIQNDIDRIKQGDISHNLKVEGCREISLFAEAFNKMKTEVYERTQDLERLTAQDPLTGIANRRYFDESLRREYHHAYRNKQPISLLLLDIDYFKRFNDSNGHLAGDACLQAVTSVLVDVVTRPSDVVSRYGGEEFAIILPMTPEKGMKAVADQVLRAIRLRAIPHDDSPISNIVTLSIGGCSIIPTDKDRMTSLINEADKALYKAKDAGRNQSVFSNDSRLTIVSGG